MFISAEQLERSLPRLQEINPFFGTAYLAFTRAGLPVGKTARLTFSGIVEDVLQAYYRPIREYPGFYSPFKTSAPSSRWLAPRYGSTSLQRITSDTFSDALIHEKGSSAWGWKPNYLKQLNQHLGGARIPAFDLAVWLFRGQKLQKNETPERFAEKLFAEFAIPHQDRDVLFDVQPPSQPARWLSNLPISVTELVDIIGRPPGAGPHIGALLRELQLLHVGPAGRLVYEPTERLNLITGDNSLGKTFLLECIWWALSGDWFAYPALPRSDVGKTKPRISFNVGSGARGQKTVKAEYDWRRQHWVSKPSREGVAGLVVYARYDGSFAIWDPARAGMSEGSPSGQSGGELRIAPAQVWNGVVIDDARRQNVWACNGVLLDWVAWQTGTRYSDRYRALTACLEGLAPSIDEPLVPGEPTRLSPFGARESPTLRMPYGDVPVQIASAGVQRVVALAYMLVWAWFEHVANSAMIRAAPQRRLVAIVDEIEAHLHPRWQRTIVPSLLKVLASLAEEATLQVHVATHSPLVLASAETDFDEVLDGLHHLKLESDRVVAERLPFVRRGRADKWLVSDVFGLNQARSVEAEQAIRDAQQLQSSRTPSPSDLVDVHKRLQQSLAQDDEYWPRWLAFAQKMGMTV